eukprot:m.169401 g.169401  ORF g.169401 m.169401 type:complete len:298 (+) comp31566_c0_seq4:394-1287(+)
MSDFDNFKNLVTTKFSSGDLSVHVKPPAKESFINIITYHELGFDARSCWEPFLNHPDAKDLVDKATIYHITAPGQGPKDKDYKPFFESDGPYPSLDLLAKQVGEVVEHFGLKSWFGLGAGAGANILLRYAAQDQERCSGLYLISPLVQQASWAEWGFKKFAEMSMVHGLPSFVQSQLISTYFSAKTASENPDLIKATTKHMETEVNAINFGLLLQAYVDRTDLKTVITQDTFAIPTLLCTGDKTQHTEKVMDAIPCFQPDKISHLELPNAGDMCHLEYPFEVVRSLKLMLAGTGRLL